ncbi:MAG: site-2 protease family protein [candidate division WOR-3 bacterium]
MFGKRIKLFKLLGFEVSLDMSWLIIFVLITWTLAEGVFPNYYKNLSIITYWLMGLAGALGLFLSIILHELSHSLVARKFNLPIKGITLFIFGGIAQMEEEPESPKAEFFMAIAGPLMSIFLGGVFYLVYIQGQKIGLPEPVNGIFGYLRLLNFVLAAFNLLPAFPLDGGRVFRAALWQIKNDLQWATRIASNIGSIFGFIFIALGVFMFLRGAFITGVWWSLIGLFMRNASSTAYKRMQLTEILKGQKVKKFMKTNPISISSSLTLKELVEDYIYTYHYKMFPVLKDDKLLGCITTREVKNMPVEKWQSIKVEEAMNKCSPENTISPEDDAIEALQKIKKSGNSRLMVTENDKLIGIITLKDLVEFFSLKFDLEGEK